MLRVLLVLSSLAACVDEPEVADVTSESLSGPIHYLEGGQWFRSLGCPSPDPSTCHREGHFWIDLAIRNDAYAKTVGVVWIDTVRDNPAAPWHVAYASYETGLTPPYERWGVDAVSGVFGGIEPNPRIRFAAFVEMAGTTSWDNNAGGDYILP